MASGKPSRVRSQIIDLLVKIGKDGIYQKDLQEILGISKSYCSEQLAHLSEVARVIARRKEGGLVKVYHLDFYPGLISGVLRIGMLRSSEYAPAMAVFDEVLDKAGFKILYRFYDGTRELFQDFNMNTLDLMLAPTKAVIMSGMVEDNLLVLSGLASGGSGIISQRAGKSAILSTELSSMISLASETMLEKLPDHIESYDNPNSALRDFKSGKYNMIAIWEPYFSKLLEIPGNNVAFRYEDTLGDFPCCIAAVNRNCYGVNRKNIEAWASEYTNLMNIGGTKNVRLKESVKKIAEVTGINREIVEKSLLSYDFSKNSISLEKLKKMGINLSARQSERLFFPGVLTN